MPRGVLTLDNALSWIAEALEKLSGVDLEDVADVNVTRAGHIARIDYVAENVTSGGGGGLNTEQVIDAVAAALTEGSNVTITYDDGAGTITLDAAGGGASAWGGITGTLSAQTDLQTALDAKLDDSQATAFGLSLLDDANAAAGRTTLGLGTLATQSGTFSGTSSGTNTGDQASIVGITGTTAQFNTALSDGDFATGGGTATGTNTGDQSLAAYATTAAVAAGYQPLDGDLTTYASITPSANVQTLLGAASFAAFRGSLGLGTSALVDTGTSGTKVALTDGANTWSAAQTLSALVTLSAGSVLTPAAVPATNAGGYLGVPQNIQNAAYTTVMADAAKHLYHTSGSAHTWTIDSNANVAYPIGTVLTFLNESGGGVVTLEITADTLRWGSSTGSRSLAANGTATAIKVTATAWRLTGDGIT